MLAGVTVLKLYRAGSGPTAQILDYDYARYIVAADREGLSPLVLFRDSKDTRRVRQMVDLLDPLRDDPDHVLAVAPSPQGTSSVWKVNLRTGATELMERGTPTTTAWSVDSQSNIVARYQARGSTLVIEGRAPGGKGWSELAKVRAKDRKGLQDFEILGGAGKPGALLVAVEPKTPEEGAARSVRIYDLASRKLSDPVWPPLKYDVAGIVYRGRGAEFAGVCYVTDTYGCDFKDPAMQAHFRGLAKYFSNDRNLSVITTSDEGRWWLLQVSGPTEPGSYYLYDMEKKGIESLGARFSSLPAPRLGPMERFVYKARDGEEIPGYLTRPPGVAADARGLPLVVLPHGGPEVRDSFDYDTLTQFLATRGYLVFQANFRGSSGYGVRYAKAGYGQWGGLMQTDLTDGVRRLIDTGRADPKRICIVGASYGGYAALYGGAREPELYRCVVSQAGVSDLLASQKWEKRVAGGEDTARYQYWLKSIGDPEKDAERLTQTSPATHAANYQAPVLLLHGLEDATVPPEQSRIMERALKRAGKDVRLVTYKGEGHTYWTPENEKAALIEIAAFLKAHLGGADAGATAPATK